MMAVKVEFVIGHTSRLRSKKTVEGFTHDWELYVKGSQQGDISAFVEKIVFVLHDSFPKPKRVCKDPPYQIQESGYAGFTVLVEIFFRNRDEPKRVLYQYDLFLQQTGPPTHSFEVKKHIFENPSEEFRQKLLRGGGVPVSGVVSSNPMQNSSVPTVTNLPGEMHKSMSAEKKHKNRPPDESKLDAFADLFGPPITKASSSKAASGATGTVAVGSSYALGANTKHSPENKVSQQASNAGISLPSTAKEKSKDKEKSTSERSKERSERKEKHHKQSGTSPHKDGRSDSKKSEGKHDKRDKGEEKSKKDKNRDKDRDRDREKTSSSTGSNVNLANSNNKKPSSPKVPRELSPQKSGPVMAAATTATAASSNNLNATARPSSSQSGKLDDIKPSSKSSKDSSSKESKTKESSSSSSGKKSKKEKKDKDKDKDKEKDKDKDKERRHEEKEKQKVSESSSKIIAPPKDEQKQVQPTNNGNSNSIANAPAPVADNKHSKNNINPALQQDVSKKLEKSTKPEVGKIAEKTAGNITALTTSLAPTSIPAAPATNDKKVSSSTVSSTSAPPPEKDKRSHKHKKKEKNKDKDKDRERDKDRDKDKDKDREKDKEKDNKRDKEVKEKVVEEKNLENFSAPNPLQQLNLSSSSGSISLATVPVNSPRINSAEDSTGINTTPSSTTSSTTTSSSSSKSSKNKEKKSKDKSSKEDKLKHKSNDAEASSESKAKQAKLSSSNSSSNSSNTPNANSITANSSNSAFPPPPIAPTAPNVTSTNSTHFDLSDNDSASSAPMEPPAAGIATTTAIPASNQAANSNASKPPQIITHSDSSNSSFPDLSITKTQKPTSQEPAKPVNPTPPPVKDAPSKFSSKSSKEKISSDKPSKNDEEKEKKRRRNSQAANTFIEPPLKQMKKETKSVREKSKSPSLRNTGSRASISEATSTFLQPGASPSSTAAAAPLPPPSLVAPSAAHSPALSATEAVGNATSATANASTTNSLASHPLPSDYLSELQELHHKIMTLQDNEDLQHVVEMIAATGCYEITTKTFDFDLCKLDRGTVQRLQEFFASSVS
ncbi:protein AF-9 [Stomoxys calcitrans]|uniref:YEATS domain-containing protein n=1 Tax=Stomoxys calcitrans TaxID=35570 RepID=A0A1I8P3K4_STOCA|nr:protein AF-9 [Stomoxys calcitrans]XP_013111406.1 protein AF-9 [Stomoxys calcitrans]XP_013111407.1 protein AF-9 [Stomoxys calcitrans]XP_059217723.1 protein AF-9 [Stomoxys calcitrans]